MKRSGLLVLLGFIAVITSANNASAYLHPGMGRFLSRDPASAGAGSPVRVGQYRDGMNLHQYVGSQPTRYVDPYGLEKKEVEIANGKMVVDTNIGVEFTATIEFVPDKEKCPQCPLIRLVQAAKSVDLETGKDWHGPADDPRYNLLTEKGWLIDHKPGNCKKGDEKCSIYYRDHWPNPQVSHDGFNEGQAVQSASLWDNPYSGRDRLFKAETCAKCVEGGQYYGCVTWGYELKESVFTAIPVGKSDRPSQEFSDAEKKFNEYYKKNE